MRKKLNAIQSGILTQDTSLARLCLEHRDTLRCVGASSTRLTLCTRFAYSACVTAIGNSPYMCFLTDSADIKWNCVILPAYGMCLCYCDRSDLPETQSDSLIFLLASSFLLLSLCIRGVQGHFTLTSKHCGLEHLCLCSLW